MDPSHWLIGKISWEEIMHLLLCAGLGLSSRSRVMSLCVCERCLFTASVLNSIATHLRSHDC